MLLSGNLIVAEHCFSILRFCAVRLLFCNPLNISHFYHLVSFSCVVITSCTPTVKAKCSMITTFATSHNWSLWLLLSTGFRFWHVLIRMIIFGYQLYYDAALDCLLFSYNTFLRMMFLFQIWGIMTKQYETSKVVRIRFENRGYKSSILSTSC